MRAEMDEIYGYFCPCVIPHIVRLIGITEDHAVADIWIDTSALSSPRIEISTYENFVSWDFPNVTKPVIAKARFVKCRKTESGEKIVPYGIVHHVEGDAR